MATGGKRSRFSLTQVQAALSDYDSDFTDDNSDAESVLVSDIEDLMDSDYTDHSSGDDSDDNGAGNAPNVNVQGPVQGVPQPAPAARNWSQVIRLPPDRPFTGHPGMNAIVNHTTDPLEYFQLYFGGNLVNLIVEETNRFAQQSVATLNLKPKSRARNWEDTTSREIRVFLALMILQGVVHKPDMAWYWSTRDTVETPYFRTCMSVNRFLLLMKFLHFVDNKTYDPATHPNPKLFKLKPVLDYLNEKFSAVYTPERDISIDESLMLWKGRLGWKQYIPIKRDRFGVKSFELCEAASGYIWKYITYTGKGTELGGAVGDIGISTQVVMRLAEDLLDKGYRIFMDNYYSSPTLYGMLMARDTDAVGTLRLNRKGVPPEVKNAKLNKGDIIARQDGNLTILKWKDKKDVTMLSTVHDATTATIHTPRGDKVKPKAVLTYNEAMGGVDLSDQMMHSYPTTRKRQKKWYKKMFRHVMNMSVHNAYCLFHKNPANAAIDQLDFRLQLVDRLIDEYYDPEMRPKKRGRKSGNEILDRLKGRHFPSIIPPTEKKTNPCRRCKVCCSHTDDQGHKKRVETRYYCPDCDVGLCTAPCFRVYHTMAQY